MKQSIGTLMGEDKLGKAGALKPNNWGRLSYWLVLLLGIALLPVQATGQRVTQRKYNADYEGVPGQSFSYMTFGYQATVPLADLSTRFGYVSGFNVALGYQWKTGISIQGEFTPWFGEVVKEDPLQNIVSSEGYIINSNGLLQSEIRYQCRAYQALGWIGGAWSMDGKGSDQVIAGIGGGFLWHKINYFYTGNEIAALQTNYRYGYDQLTGGPAVALRVGYQRVSKEGYLRFRVEPMILFASTKHLRGYDLWTQRASADIPTRNDVVLAVRANFYLPFVSQAADGFTR